MRKIIVTLVFGLALVPLQLNAQYRVLADDPSKLIKGHIAIEYLTVDAGFSNLSGAYGWAIGANGLYPLNGKIGIEGAIRTPILKLTSEGGTAIFAEGGINFLFKSSIRKKDKVTILVGFQESRGLYTTTRTTETLTVPGTVRSEIFLRGGGYYRTTAYEYQDQGFFTEYGIITHSGVYAGIGISKGKFFQLQNANSGSQFANGNIFKFYADVLLLPTSIDAPGIDAQGTIGWRLGVKWYNSPYKAEDNFDKKKGFFGNMFALMELGSRPEEGATVTASVGYIIKKF